jgi:hypothetical protein
MSDSLIEKPFSARFRDALSHNWQERVRSLLIAIAVGVASSFLLGSFFLLQEANRTAFAAVQKRLGDDDRDTQSVAIVDLSFAIGHRDKAPITVGETLPDGSVLPSPGQEAYGRQIESLTELLEALGSHKPKAIFVDWQTTAPTELWDAQNERWREGVSPEFKEAYARLLSTMDSLSPTCQVFVAGDLVQDLIAARLKTAPGRRYDIALVRSELPKTEWYPYFPLAQIQAGSGKSLPSVTDRIIAFDELEDRVSQRPTKWGLFEASTSLEGMEGFWIDYGYVPSLVREALYLNLTEWTDPNRAADLTERIGGKVVFVTDLTDPQGEDAISIPVRPESLIVPLAEGMEVEARGSGGIAHACAFLTRTQGPLYALPAGPKEYVFFGVINILIALVAWLLSSFIGAIRQTDLESRQEVGLELFLLISLTIAIGWRALDWMADTSIVIPQIEGFLVTRFVDTVLLVPALWKSEKKQTGEKAQAKD